MFGMSVDEMIRSGGILLVSFIIFAESGLLVGFFLPGDTLLFGAGLAASQGEIHLYWLLLSVILAAIIGDNVGYSIGRRTGPRIFSHKDGIIFRQEYIQRAEKFYDKHGGKTIIIARFTPVVRTFAPIVAGAGKMTRRRFFTYNVVGAILWGAGITLLGYWFGKRIPNLDKYIEVVIVGIMGLSIAIAMLHILRDRRTRQQLWGASKDGIRRAYRMVFLIRPGQ